MPVYSFGKGLRTSHWVALILAAILLLVYFVSCAAKGGDFVTFLEASVKMINRQNIYAPPYVNLRYSYSPFWAMVLVPLALLPTGAGAFLWLVLSFFLLIRTFYLIRYSFGIRLSDTRHDMALWGMVLLFTLRYIELNFHHVQMTIFLLWLMIEALSILPGRQFLAGVLIGLGSIIKIMPVVMLFYFVYRGKWKAALGTIITIAVAFFIPMIFLGRKMFLEMNQSWFGILRPDSNEFQTEAAWHLPHNLSLLLYRILIDVDSPYRMNIFHFDLTTATDVIWGVIAILILFTLYFLNSFPFSKALSRTYQLYEVSYICLLIPLIFPHQMKYAFYFVLPATACLLYALINKYLDAERDIAFYITAILVGVSFALCTLTTDLLIGMSFSVVTQHFKTITVGTLLLIPALAVNRSYFASLKDENHL